MNTIILSTDQESSMPDGIHHNQKEIVIDESITIFVQSVYEHLTIEDYVNNADAANALSRCCDRLQNKYNSLLLEDLIVAYPLLVISHQKLTQELSNDDGMKAPREETRPNIVGPGVCDISSLRNLLNMISMNLNQCCQQIENDFIITFSLLNNFLVTVSMLINDINISVSESVNTLTTIFENITACFAISVTAPETISQSGYYCLANNVSGSFIIAADDVTLDLNAHTISTGGVIVQSGIVGTVIKNGRITDSTVGIILNQTTNATVQDISITDSPGLTAITATGNGNEFTNIYIDTVATGFSGDGVNPNNYLLMDGLTVANTTGTGILFNGGLTDSTIKNVNVAVCASNGVVAQGTCLYNVFSNVSIYAVNQFGFYFFDSTSIAGCDLINVSVSGMGTAAGAGIYATLATGFRFISCAVRDSAASAFSYFRIDSGFNDLFDSCIAEATPDIGLANFGFQIASQETIIKNCQVLNLQQTSGTLAAFYSDAPFNQFIDCIASGILGIDVGPEIDVIGFQLNINAGTNNILTNCQATNIQSNVGNATGFLSAASFVQFNNCIASGIASTVGSFSTAAMGFMITEQALNNSVIDCQATAISNFFGQSRGFYMAALNGQLTNCIALDIDMTMTNNTTQFGSAVGFQIQPGGSQWVLINCQATDIQLSAAVVNPANFCVGFLINTFDVSLYGCTANQCGSFLTGNSWGFLINPTALHVLCENCTAINSDGFGFESNTQYSMFIGCVASNHGAAGFQLNAPGTYVLRDCTSMYNNGAGFANDAGTGLVNAINCYATFNIGGDYTGSFVFPNVQTAGSASPVVGVNISA